ncbi:DUF1156 domain-containing protein [Acidipropionibacterium acidipropionici]|uniref:DUF1156 domain-containing protein n=1 Tax=Acidipropionibacterium acidipropionici TaxID=1748 RepID=UPI0004114E74|nr:DUF1156 domain-containing protein [Acidipropionibacterium acidipropionici]APZ09760.1 hypothetical protein BWX38_11490 [Acidipropionibacterium acidipropionici]
MSVRRKLIEVSLPLDEINAQAAREKSIRHGHPSTLHLWWARRPLAAARCVLFAQLVDDPASREDDIAEKYRAKGLPEDQVEKMTSAEVIIERQRLHDMLAKLANWDNLNDEKLWNDARTEIQKSCDGNPPAILDPFAGGGTIPLEAQRLGLEAHASDLNPVAVLINKAMIEIPPKFADMPPVHPNAQDKLLGWKGAQGLADDVRYYGTWMKAEAEKRIGHLYPKATLEDGAEANVIAWIWARTVTCPNPVCGIEMPLVRSWWLGKKKGKEAYVVPEVVDGKVHFSIGHDPKQAPTKDNDGTVGRQGGHCIACGSAVDFTYIRSEGQAQRIGERLMGVVAEGKRCRVYLNPTPTHIEAADIEPPSRVPQGELFDWPGRINVVRYGITKFSQLFTNRQLVALTTFSDLVGEARERVLADADTRASTSPGSNSDAAAYADAVATYLAMTLSRMANKSTTIATWDSSSKMEAVRSVFSRQALPMSWDYAEANCFADSSGSFKADIKWICDSIEALPSTGPSGVARQGDAANLVSTTLLLSTDPPYYDNIGYSDLSDFFYVWLRRSLKAIYPDLFRSLLVPKDEELVANPYRHNGRSGAEEFFEDGFRSVFRHAREHARNDYPMTVYYAFKQADTKASGTASTGWETLLEGMVREGWEVTATWPMRSELSNRMLASGTNALASSIVLALRPRPKDAPMIDKREFRDELRKSLPERLRELQQGAIAPVDLAQAAIGPGMGVFSRYRRVLEADGSSVTVREALVMINTVLDEVLSEQEGDYDEVTRWCIKWFGQYGFTEQAYGIAETLASAVNTSVATVERSGAAWAHGGKARLLSPDDLELGYRPDRDATVTTWEITLHAAFALRVASVDEAARIVAQASDRVEPQTVKELAYLCFSLADKRKDSQTAQLYNDLVTSWPDVTASLDDLKRAGVTRIFDSQEELPMEEELWH